MHRILVTGASGFIGFHLCEALLKLGKEVTGIDSMNHYYDPGLKRARLQMLQAYPSFRFYEADLNDAEKLETSFKNGSFDAVVHLAAQAGVRHSLVKPFEYTENNITAFLQVLEMCRKYPVRHLLYASSSSVYGLNSKIPFAEDDATDQPASLYAATKKANELMAHSYAHLFGIPATGLRFFTVYGPWGRPDMAYYGFARSIIRGLPIRVFNHGMMERDFTYIGDVVIALTRLLELPLDTKAGVPHRVVNIGNHDPVELSRFVALLEQMLGRKAILEYLPMEPGDVLRTFAANDVLYKLTGYRPHTDIEEGLRIFADWIKTYES